jgi:hypothetical protein
MLTTRDLNRPHVVDSRPRIDQTWLIAVWTCHMEKLGTRIARSEEFSQAIGKQFQKLRWEKVVSPTDPQSPWEPVMA